MREDREIKVIGDFILWPNEKNYDALREIEPESYKGRVMRCALMYLYAHRLPIEITSIVDVLQETDDLGSVGGVAGIVHYTDSFKYREEGLRI